MTQKPFVLAGVLALAAAGLACGGGHERARSTGAAQDSAPPVAVTSAPVVREAGAGLRPVPATVQARERATLSARIPASVVELPYREGERVAKGAVLVRLDDSALRSGLNAAEAAQRAAAADLARSESLLAKGAATQRELDAARARAAEAEAAVSAARDNISYAVLRAPFAGTIVSRAANLGDVASPGRPLIELQGETGLELVASVEADLVGALRPGEAIDAQVDGQSGPVRAVVRAVAPAGDPSTHRFEVKADLPGVAGLRAGLFARLLLPAPGAAEARLFVPASAVFRRGGLQGVFVIAEGRASLRYVAAGASQAGRTEIRSGVAEGERVALDPAPLADGVRVSEQPAAAGSPAAEGR